MQTPPGIAALLAPRAIAIVGATPRPDSLGGRPALNLATHGFRGRVYPVNPRYQDIGGKRCYPELAALPEPVDVVMVLLGADRVIETLDQAVAAQARTAIVFGGGFAELGAEGAARQARLGAYAQQGLRICGPNCNGVFNVRAGIAMGFSPAFEAPARPGHVALLSQSGAIATSVSSRGMQNGLGFSHVVATGNEADLEISDFIEHLTGDPDVTAFACFIEGLKDPGRFLRAARAALAAGKPIVAVKAGRSAQGQAMSLSHTGAMTGSYEVLAGVMRQSGVIVVDTLDALIGVSALFATGLRPRGGGAAVMSLSGGMASLIADQCSEHGVPLAPFAEPTRTTLRQVLPPIATVSNPLDVTGQAVTDPALWSNCTAAVAADPGVDAIVAILSILASQADQRLCQDMIAAATGTLRIAVWASAAPPGSGVEALRAAGIPVFLGAEEAVRAVASWRHYWSTRAARLADDPDRTLPDFVATSEDAWAVLAAAGLPLARFALVPSRAALPEALARLRPPLALKIQSDDIAHKTELNLLRLSVRTPAEAAAEFDALMADAKRLRPEAAIDGVLVQEMFSGKRELILGMRHEPGLGPVVIFGIGGIFAEILRDVSIRRVPVSAFDAAEMLGELRGHALLGPVRGLGAARSGMLAEVIGQFSALALHHGQRWTEFEINPLILADDGQSCAAVDVLIGRMLERQA